MTKYTVGPGWWPLLDEQISKARKLAPDVTYQEKEKYGRCDIYFFSETLGGTSEELFEIQMETTKKSLQICEVCGQSGRLRERRYMQTLCDRCAELGPKELYELQASVEEAYRDNS